MQQDLQMDAAVAASAMRKASWRILPLLGLGYLVAYIDRANISFAATQMNHDLHFTATIYGLGGGMFFLSYGLFEVPSNLLLVRFGARRWLARIMITWGLLAAAMMFVRTPVQFYVVRFLLGFAEAGFFPGVIFYLAGWFPKAQRGRAVTRFYSFGSLSTVVMGIVSAWLLKLDGLGGLRGWHWLFLCEGLPAVVVGLLILKLLPETPAASTWLDSAEKESIASALAQEHARLGDPGDHNLLATLRNPLVLQLGLIGAFGIGSFYALSLNAPSLLLAATGWTITQVGLVTSVGGLLAWLGMLSSGALSDRLGSRFGIYIASSLLLAGACALLALGTTSALVVAGYLAFVSVWSSVTSSHVLLWADLLPPRTLAAACAAINSMTMVGGFLGPYLWGWAKDATGTYSFALGAMCCAMLLAAGMATALRARTQRSLTLGLAQISA